MQTQTLRLYSTTTSIDSPASIQKLISIQTEPLLAKEIFHLASHQPNFHHSYSSYHTLIVKLGRAHHFTLMQSILNRIITTPFPSLPVSSATYSTSTPKPIYLTKSSKLTLCLSLTGFCKVGKIEEGCKVLLAMLELGEAPHMDNWVLVVPRICGVDEDSEMLQLLKSLQKIEINQNTRIIDAGAGLEDYLINKISAMQRQWRRP